MPPLDATVDSSPTYFLFNAETAAWDELSDVSYEEGCQRPIVDHPDELVTDATLIFTLPEGLKYGQVSFIKIVGYAPASSSDKIKSNMLKEEESDKGQKIWSDLHWIAVEEPQENAQRDYFNFMYGDRRTGDVTNLSFGLRYYQSYDDGGQPSGAYVFRPTQDYYDSFLYAAVSSYTKMSNSSMKVEFAGVEDGERAAIAYFRLNNDASFMTVEVELFGLPDSLQNEIGHEVTVNFFSPDIDNQGVFYTDSNGLEM
jgi:hypothetical protein